jgi:DNA repair photolyase
LIARNDVIKVIKEHGRAEIVFTYTGLKGLEPNLPYDSRNFPSEAVKKLTSNKIRVILLYKPIIPGLNDKEEKIRNVFKKAKEVGITEVSAGFLKINYRFQNSIKANSRRYYRYFKEVLTDQIEKDFLPPFRYRVQMIKKLRKICDNLGLRISFCQPYIGDLKSELVNSFCPCRKERWQ